VRDPQGAVISAAKVKLQNTSTGLERSVESNENGEFNFSQLAWHYQITVSKPGFQTVSYRYHHITEPGEHALARLKVGTVTSEVEVISLPPLIQTKRIPWRATLEVQVKALPIGNSDYTRLALTLPAPRRTATLPSRNTH